MLPKQLALLGLVLVLSYLDVLKGVLLTCRASTGKSKT